MAQIRQAECGNAPGGVTLPPATEILVLVSPPMAVPLDCERVYVLFQYALAGGADALGFTPKIYRGVDATGVLVSNAVEQALITPGGSGQSAVLAIVDNPGELDFVQYALTLTVDSPDDNGLTGTSAVLVLAF